MASKSKLRKRIRKLEKRVLQLIVECNDARVRAAEWYEAFQEADAADILAEWPSDEEIAAMTRAKYDA